MYKTRVHSVSSANHTILWYLFPALNSPSWSLSTCSDWSLLEDAAKLKMQPIFFFFKELRLCISEQGYYIWEQLVKNTANNALCICNFLKYGAKGFWLRSVFHVYHNIYYADQNFIKHFTFLYRKLLHLSSSSPKCKLP